MKLFKKLKTKIQNHFEWRKEHRQKNKKWKAALTDIHKRYIPEKWDRIKNHQWKKEWAPFIKYDHDWDWSYLMDLLMYKLEKMKAALTIYTSATPEWPERIEKEIDEVLALGHKVLEYDYEEAAHEFSQAHTKPYIIVFNVKVKGNTLAERLESLYSKENELTKIYVERSDDEFEYISNRNKAAKQWCFDNNIDLNTVNFAYGSDWDDEANSEVWRSMLDQAEKNKQADYDQFFLLISKYLRGWWD